MKTTSHIPKFAIPIIIIMFLILTFIPTTVVCHCDTMNGPVVKAAQKALETGNLNYVLIWVQPKDEAIIKESFGKTIAIRKLSQGARELADMYFFETLVRVHRAGEGAPYTGLKPADAEVEPGIEAADQAVEAGSAKLLAGELAGTIRGEILKHFEEVERTRNYKVDDVDAGREYVKSYVEFIHYVERLYQAATTPVVGHECGSEGAETHGKGD